MRKMIISIEIIIAIILASVLVGATYSVSKETTSIGGQVTSSYGRPLSGAIISAQSSHKTEYAISDDSGWYVLNNIPIFEEIKISCTKTHYKTFQTSIYIDMIGVCPVLNIELQKKNNNIRENSIVLSNLPSSFLINWYPVNKKKEWVDNMVEKKYSPEYIKKIIAMLERHEKEMKKKVLR